MSFKKPVGITLMEEQKHSSYIKSMLTFL